MTPSMLSPALHDEGRSYLLDMISELAKLARKIGETSIAIHLEAIHAAARAAQGECSAG